MPVCAGDALSVCFNTVAVLFILDVDNLTFEFLLSEKLRSAVEKRGQIELDDAQAASLARTKLVHSVLIMVEVIGGVALGLLKAVEALHDAREVRAMPQPE